MSRALRERAPCVFREETRTIYEEVAFSPNHKAAVGASRREEGATPAKIWVERF